MRKKRIFLSIAVLMCLFFAMPVSAEEMIPYSRELSGERLKPRIVDEAGILSADELEDLQSTLDDMSKRHACDVVIAIADSLDGMDAQSYADDYFDYNGFGMGDADGGIVFLISMGEREWAFSTYGYGVDAFTDKALEHMEDEILPYLSDGDYYEAFLTYTKEADAALTYARELETSENISIGEHLYYEEEQSLLTRLLKVLSYLPISILIGMAVAYIHKCHAVKQYSGVIDNQRSMTKSYASNMRLTKNQTLPMGRGVHRIHSPRKKQNDGGHVHHGHVGSSTMHHSSSGRSHGGRSGRF